MPDLWKTSIQGNFLLRQGSCRWVASKKKGEKSCLKETVLVELAINNNNNDFISIALFHVKHA